MTSDINLFLLQISSSKNTTGVDRYISTLISGLQSYPHIKIHWICLVSGDNLLFPNEGEIYNCIKYTIPLPQGYRNTVAVPYWTRKYNEQVYRLIMHLFEKKQNCILHLHTLNLIDLALLIKERNQCKIITHLHCIPWKWSYDYDKKFFNQLYRKTYIDELKDSEKQNLPYITSNYELLSYISSDVQLCVTKSALNFLKNCANIPTNNTFVIPNGIDDSVSPLSISTTRKLEYETYHCLYAGIVNESKGVKYILKALDIVRKRGYNITLTVAGLCSLNFQIDTKRKFPELDVDFRGRVSYEELKSLYEISDIGIIASLQEQSSYVAIEMAMYGLPIITTAVDGLDEIFTDEVNALKVKTNFSSVYGLSVDTEMMANQVIRLIKNIELREMLSRNARLLYETTLTAKDMVRKTVNVYNKLIENKL